MRTRSFVVYAGQSEEVWHHPFMTPDEDCYAQNYEVPNEDISAIVFADQRWSPPSGAPGSGAIGSLETRHQHTVADGWSGGARWRAQSCSCSGSSTSAMSYGGLIPLEQIEGAWPGENVLGPFSVRENIPFSPGRRLGSQRSG